MSAGGRHERVFRAARAVIVAAGGVVGVTMALVLVMGIWQRLAPPRRPAYAVGEVADVPSRLWRGGRATLVIFARSNCPRCRDARDYLAGLIAEATRIEGVRAVLLTGGWHLPDEILFAEDLGLGPDAVEPLPDGLRVSLVPTVILVAGDGRIRFVSQDVSDEVEQGGRLRALGQVIDELAGP